MTAPRDTAAMERPVEPTDDALVWYRGWEVGYGIVGALWSGEAWQAYQGGCDLDAATVSGRTFDDCLDAIDAECADDQVSA